ncbi:MAG: hypothetical protein NUV47_01465 [Patescibacteria group bacterium]|nr:hypothetical protein [Patescibacteria group bacterium]
MHISKNLEKFIDLGKEENLLKDKIVLVLSNYYKTSFSKSDVFLKEGVVKIKASPLIKNDIFIKKKEILNLIKEIAPNITNLV